MKPFIIAFVLALAISCTMGSYQNAKKYVGVRYSPNFHNQGILPSSRASKPYGELEIVDSFGCQKMGTRIYDVTDAEAGVKFPNVARF